MSGSANVSTGNPIADAVIDTLAKPGTKTTEFLVTMVVHSGSAAALLGAFDTHSALGNALLKVAALLAGAGAQYGYAHSRGTTKAALGAVLGWVDGPASAPPLLAAPPAPAVPAPAAPPVTG